MKSIVLLVAFLFGAGAAALAYSAPPASSGKLSCTLGPVSKTFGGSSWLMYGCSDGQSVVVVTAPGNPAAPFYFIFTPGAKGMELHGEGTGNKQASAGAFKQLKALNQAGVAALFQQAKAHASAGAGAHAT
jgi:hypothetical protein